MNVATVARRGRFLLACALFALLATAAHADEPLEAHPFEVKGGAVALVDGVLRLDAEIDFDLTPPAREALDNGVPLTFVLEIQVERDRGWWFNESAANLTQRYRLRYHALSRRYVITNLNSGDNRSYGSREAALAALGSIDDLPLIDRRLLKSPGSYEVWLRARLDIDELPAPLRTVAYMSPAWRLVSEWYVWPLKL